MSRENEFLGADYVMHGIEVIQKANQFQEEEKTSSPLPNESDVDTENKDKEEQ